jgi:hypothetical protein
MMNKMQLQQAKTEGDKNYLNRKCERLEKEIDQFARQVEKENQNLFLLLFLPEGRRKNDYYGK